jgi:hypothetical protein
MRKYLFFLFSFMLPVLSFAQNTGYVPGSANGQTIGGLLLTGQSLLNLIIRVLFVLAILYIIWGAIQFISRDGADKKEEAKNTILYGVLALFVMTSIWGLVGVLRRSTGIGENQERVNIPCVGGPGVNC